MRIWLAPAAVLLMTQAAPAVGQGQPSRPGQEREIPSPITDRFYLRGTYFAPSVSTLLRVDPTPGVPGTLVAGEEDLGIDDEVNQGRLELMFRMTDRNRLRFDFFKLDRYGDQVLNRTIVFGDETFDINERATSSLDWRMLGFTYTYSVLRFRPFELGLGVGIHLLEAEARGEVPARQQREEVSGVGAFPTAALDMTWRISSRFAFTARGQYFSASVDEFDGSLGDYHADVQYRWKPNFAVGLGYSSIVAQLDVADDDFPGFFDLDVSGPELFFRVSF